MNEFSRLSLYNQLIVDLESVTQKLNGEMGLHAYDMHEDLLTSEQIKDGTDSEYLYRLIELFKFNVKILEDIEPRFIFNEDSVGSVTDLSKHELMELYHRNLGNALSEDTNKHFLELLEETKHYDLINKYENDIANSKGAKNAFNTLLRLLAELNNTYFKKFITYNFSNFRIGEHGKGDMNFVFLSHAYDDKAYTFALYNYMLTKRVFLYIDWMQNPLLDGKAVKSSLVQAIDRSEQLLFLRSPHSELRIGGGSMIRGWCSWELGVFYCSHGRCSNEKFYLNIYSQNRLPNKQMEGIEPLRSINSNGRLC